MNSDPRIAVRIRIAFIAFRRIAGKAGSIDEQVVVAHQMYETPFVVLAASNPYPTVGRRAALAAVPTRKKTNETISGSSSSNTISNACLVT